MSKKFSFKFPSTILLYLVQHLLHHAEASENKQEAANNVIDDHKILKMPM